MELFKHLSVRPLVQIMDINVNKILVIKLTERIYGAL